MSDINKRNFDLEANEWDKDQSKIDMAAAVGNAIVKDLNINKDDIVLDFGAGTGIASLIVAEHAKSLFAIDDSIGMLEILKQKIETYKLNNINIGEWDIESEIKLDIKDITPDVVMSSMTIHHLENVDQAMLKFYDILSEGGWIAIGDLEKEKGDFHSDSTGVHHNGFEPAEFKKILKNAGFTNISYRNIYNIRKKTKDGIEKEFPVFLIIGQKVN